MAHTPKIKRQWVKEEKITMRLLYKKGLLEGFKIKDLYWQEYYYTKKHCKTKGGFCHCIYMPEVYYSTTDYWGETDEHSVVDHVKQDLYWGAVDVSEMDEDGLPQSKFPRMNRRQFIAYLKRLPTKVNDRRINTILNKRVIE